MAGARESGEGAARDGCGEAGAASGSAGPDRAASEPEHGQRPTDAAAERTLALIRQGLPYCMFCLAELRWHPVAEWWVHAETSFRRCRPLDPLDRTVATLANPDLHGPKRTDDPGDVVSLNRPSTGGGWLT
jgi:hypothetical protein